MKQYLGQPIKTHEDLYRAAVSSASKSAVHTRKSGRPKSRFHSLLGAPGKAWRRSIAKIVVDEIYRFPLRIGVILSNKYRGCQVGIPVASCPVQMSFREEYAFLVACNAGMAQLVTENRWMGPVEAQVAGKGFALGAKWAFDTYSRQTESADEAKLSQ